MLSYPQLSTGAIAQFPLSKLLTHRTVVNQLPDGTTVTTGDPNYSVVLWTLEYRGLTDAERSALEELFVAAGGQLSQFVFLDPTANLLRWSEDLTNSVWGVDPLLHATQRVDDPDGGNSAVRIINGAQTRQGVQQDCSVPGGKRYTFSVYVRSEYRERVTLRLAEATADCPTGPEWSRVSCVAELPDDAETASCRLEVDGGGIVEVYGFQLDAQPGAAEYRRSTDVAGVYSNARFADDRLDFTANGADDHATAVRVITRMRQSQ